MFKPYIISVSCLVLAQTAFMGHASAQTTQHDIFESKAQSVQTASLTPDIVVELFTSQGCSSCPAANKFTSKLSSDPEKLILTYGVTYWDYLGWKDTFGRPEFTDRQRAYGRALHIGNVYTPQMVLNGSAHSPRYSRKDVETMELPPLRPIVELVNSASGLIVKLPKDVSLADTEVTLITYVPGEQDVDVRKGENRGRTLRVANVVTQVKTLKAQNQYVINSAIRPESGYAYAALIQDRQTGKIVTATRYLNE